MFCNQCGGPHPDGAAFCSACGTALTGPDAGGRTSSERTGNAFSIAGIICGAVAFLFFPIVLGPVGLILAAVARSKGEQKAVIAMTVSGLGLVVGMFLGALVATGS